MKDHMLLTQMKFWRSRTLTSLNATPEKDFDQVPSGFNNSIQWNFGHILFSQESLIRLGTGRTLSLPDQYNRLFAGGTKPANWKEEPPSFADIKERLEKQTIDLEKYLTDKLDQKLIEPFQIGPILQMTTVAELVNFTVCHEVLHLGTINGIKRAIGIKELWQ